ncbi:hypothetical protein AURDEDRAFT_156023 [Auricularia subglabra TFB-10046 SS5]|nr:hypothetical protein AURDEDRAFT_156023 [Auricularia subglabra TFB-10046 SS5]
MLSFPAAAFAVGWLQTALAAATSSDPCTKIANVQWAASSDVRACFSVFPLNETIRANTMEVVSKTLLNFHASVNYQLQAPPPFQNDVHVDLPKELERIQTQTYPSYFAFHQDLQNTLRTLRDGHADYSSLCFDSLFISYIPFPLVVVESPSPSSSIHIAPEAFDVVSAEFADAVPFWQAQPGLEDLASFNGAQVVAIDGQDPWNAVDKNAAVAGGFQSHATRQNGFFSSYISGAQRGPGEPVWEYRMGEFAERELPLVDRVSLTVIKRGKVDPETITAPYRARIADDFVPFSDAPSFFAGNCLKSPFGDERVKVGFIASTTVKLNTYPARRSLAQNVLTLANVPSDLSLPPRLTPGPTLSLSGGAEAFMLDNTTGVLTLSSFATVYNGKTEGMLTGLQKLKQAGATRLIIDVTNNPGGGICLAHWLHRILAGPNPNSVPQAGLDTELRAQALPIKIVKSIIEDNADPDGSSDYRPQRWRFPNSTQIPASFNYLDPGVKLTVNGRPDQFSVRLGQECQPFTIAIPPDEPLFDLSKVVIVGNGRCASACALFSIAMSIYYGVKTVVVGGKPRVQQSYCGTVGGESSNHLALRYELGIVGLQDDPLAPPDFLSSSFLGITWRLGFSIRDPSEPEEWQDHPATVSYTPTLETVNNPTAIWAAIADDLL